MVLRFCEPGETNHLRYSAEPTHNLGLQKGKKLQSAEGFALLVWESEKKLRR